MLVPLDIPAALDRLGFEFTVTGNEAKALCPDPEHDDTTPSWSINLDSGMHNCFSCGFGGSFVRLVMMELDYTRPKAYDWIKKQKVRDIAEGKTGRKKSQKKHAEITEADLWEFVNVYPEDELEYRGFDANDARWFKLLWDQQRDGWIIPFYNAVDERLIGYQFKPHHGSGGTVKNYPPNMKKTGRLFESLKYIEDDILIIVESPLDVVRLYAMGFENVVSTFGAHLDEEQADLIIDKFSKVILAFDDDEAGRKGVMLAASFLKGVEVLVFAYSYPQKMGPYWVHHEITNKDPGNLTAVEFSEGIARATHVFRTGFM